jgi:hypothetical protein
MIDRARLLEDLQKLQKRLEADLRERAGEVPEVAAALEAEHGRAREAKRTAQAYPAWRDEQATQLAAAWILTAVFARFLEDNRLVDPPRISGPPPRGASREGGGTREGGENRLARARDEYELHIRARPADTDRDYLLRVFAELAELPAAREVFAGHNPIAARPLWLSGDAGRELLSYFQKIDPATGTLIHDFTDERWDTRFLGDLYQDLSLEARKRYALLQTPEFVEEFILERTLDPAAGEFGLEGFRLIDPACGSGHFLLGAFRRLLERWRKAEPGTDGRELVRRSLESIAGVDLNPYAAAISRFRLLLEAMRECGLRRLADAPAFDLQVACGDALLHGRPAGDQLLFDADPLAHAYASEDVPRLRQILAPGRYHAVVGNPPYITVKDAALNQAYRERFGACHRKYSLSVPFLERFFQLARDGGYTGQITANSFMKREFGKKLIETYLPRVDLTHVVDTSGAYIPGHGTPTVILFGRNRKRVGGHVRGVLGIRGEPATPEDASQGLVWRSIVDNVDRPGVQTEFVSVCELAREALGKHPWSIGGGGAAELKEALDEAGVCTLSDLILDVGRTTHTGEDDVFYLPQAAANTRRLGPLCVPLVIGEDIRDYQVAWQLMSFFPYDKKSAEAIEVESPEWVRVLWSFRARLRARIDFGQRIEHRGLRWFDHSMFFPGRFRTPLSIAFAEVASHNHFVLDRGGKVFKQTAPVIKLPEGATEDDHLALLGLLNSSTACFWLHQACHSKGGPGGACTKDEKWHDFYQYNGARVAQFPIPLAKPLPLARRLDQLGRSLSACTPAALIAAWAADPDRLTDALEDARRQWLATRREMIALQEELDWQCYHLYGLTPEPLTYDRDDLPGLELGQRAFEIVLARKAASGEAETAWFERHGSTPITEIPGEWPAGYRDLVERRIDLIERDLDVGLIEQPEYKRRWSAAPWEEEARGALRDFLLERLESFFDHDGPMHPESPPGKPAALLEKQLIPAVRLADIASGDPLFLEAAEVYRGRPDFDIARLVEELVAEESVPLLPVLRYKPSGLEKRRLWERTWELQRLEDEIEARTKLPAGDLRRLGEEEARREKKERGLEQLPVPPKYKDGDFQRSSYWRLRGKLDVPKERWVSFPHCESEDGSLVIAWAGLDHLELARAVSACYVQVKEKTGGSGDPRLEPLLAALLELLPWLKQWHNEVDPEYGLRMGDYFAGFVEEEGRELRKSLEETAAWEPPKRSRPGRRNNAARTQRSRRNGTA